MVIQRMKRTTTLLLLIATLIVTACEAGYFVGSDEEENVEEEDINVWVSTRADEENDLEGCTRIDVGVFLDGEKVKAVNSKAEDSDFGTIGLSLDEGLYEIVIIAHSGTGAATISSPDEIKFSNNKVTDTFYYYGNLNVSAAGGTFAVVLKRAVAMFRLVINDKTPTDVTQMKFYYTGGSSTFDATSGYGCVNSRQTEYRDVETLAYTDSSQYEIYTFPHVDDDVLKIVVTAQNSLEEELYERTFTDVSVNIDEITLYSGSFFTTSSTATTTIMVSVEGEWVVNEYEY